MFGRLYHGKIFNHFGGLHYGKILINFVDGSNLAIL
jgi:hypothetical protein